MKSLNERSNFNPVLKIDWNKMKITWYPISFVQMLAGIWRQLLCFLGHIYLIFAELRYRRTFVSKCLITQTGMRGNCVKLKKWWVDKSYKKENKEETDEEGDEGWVTQTVFREQRSDGLHCWVCVLQLPRLFHRDGNNSGAFQLWQPYR